METPCNCGLSGCYFVPPSGGSLEIGNSQFGGYDSGEPLSKVPPSGGSLEIGNFDLSNSHDTLLRVVPPSGGSLEIGNTSAG